MLFELRRQLTVINADGCDRCINVAPHCHIHQPRGPRKLTTEQVEQRRGPLRLGPLDDADQLCAVVVKEFLGASGRHLTCGCLNGTAYQTQHGADAWTLRHLLLCFPSATRLHNIFE